uniref:Uncharacterized protein n=1 Tax=Anguilla anguilla TaxID=7936 RepID=A0A0E9VSW6_ANGAN
MFNAQKCSPLCLLYSRLICIHFRIPLKEAGPHFHSSPGTVNLGKNPTASVDILSNYSVLPCVYFFFLITSSILPAFWVLSFNPPQSYIHFLFA